MEDNITKEDALFRRRGSVKFNRSLLMESNEETLRAIFSNFFPIASQPDHGFGFYDRVVMYGCSPHFRLVEEGEIMPEYQLSLITDQKGNIFFEKVTEVKENG